MVGKSEVELAVDVQLASRAVSRWFERADERPKVRVKAPRVRRRRLCGNFFRILEGSCPRKLTVQIAPGVGFGACEHRVHACARFSRRHRKMIPIKTLQGLVDNAPRRAQHLAEQSVHGP
jgi:hypothetical protein